MYVLLKSKCKPLNAQVVSNLSPMHVRNDNAKEKPSKGTTKEEICGQERDLATL